MKLVSRGDTTTVDAYLSPILRRYVNQVASELGDTRYDTRYEASTLSCLLTLLTLLVCLSITPPPRHPYF